MNANNELDVLDPKSPGGCRLQVIGANTMQAGAVHSVLGMTAGGSSTMAPHEPCERTKAWCR